MKICKDYISLFFEILKRYGHIEYDYIEFLVMMGEVSLET